MTIATFNIDWAKKYSSKTHINKLEKKLSEFNFDFLILTESVDLELPNYKYKYFSKRIPRNELYEKLNYTEYLKGYDAYRTAIYTNIPSIKKYNVEDDKTSLALEFDTKKGTVVFYVTIIGTWFKKQPFAKKELENCVNDCKRIFIKNKNIVITGDFNTSFLETETDFTINNETTNSLKKLFKELNLYNSTKEIEKNIDHIVIPNIFKYSIKDINVFVNKNELSDHKGVVISLRDNL